ncbi:MAG: SagB/ThcOx family dehydrogenase [Gaiellaceae bacterium]
MRARHAPLVRAEVYGDDGPELDDPAELFHEASKLHPALAQREAAGIVRLETSDVLLRAAAHPVRRNPQLPATDLPRPLRPHCSLWSALERRRSRRAFAGELGADQLATLLDAAYGIRAGNRRTVPSAGALYPLEIHVAIRSRGMYRYDPELHALEEHDLCDPWPALEAACPLPELLENGFAALLLLAVFGRTRFKYGQRGYRFALLEAGHVAQNVALAAAALGLPALPLGGFYDAQLDELVGADGVEESVVYAVIV